MFFVRLDVKKVLAMTGCLLDCALPTPSVGAGLIVI
jgi:hypothetical protein